MPTPLTTRPRRAGLALLAAGLLATGMTACEPPKPPPAFTVDPVATGPDVEPGDGICATEADACSLQAAVEEANALDTPTDISLPDGEVAPVALEVTTSIDVTASETWADMEAVSFTVAEGAKLTVTDGGIRSAVVHGTLGTRRATLGRTVEAVDPNLTALLEVGPTGRVMLTNTEAVAWFAPLAVNAGMLVLHSTTVGTTDTTYGPDVASITTLDGAETRFAASVFLGDTETSVDVCDGLRPISFGYNLAANDSCQLENVGDRQDVSDIGWMPELDQDDPRMDAIPVGALYCGETWTDDLTPGEPEVARPTDGDGDETPACDIGAYEA
jgi:hypothetical protein